MARIFLVVVGLMYAGLAIWCSIAPETTSQKVGFDLLGGSGDSEFLTVYGGLEMGMAFLFLSAALRNRRFLYYGLTACVALHGFLVLFRTAGFVFYEGFSSITYRLAVGEWIVFLLGSVILFRDLKKQSLED